MSSKQNKRLITILLCCVLPLTTWSHGDGGRAMASLVLGVFRVPTRTLQPEW